MTLGQALRAVREPLLTQQQLAAKTGGKQNTISDWEHDKNEVGVTELAAIEDALDVRRGTVLRLAGFVVDTSIEELIESDPTLPPRSKPAILQAYRDAKRRRR